MLENIHHPPTERKEAAGLSMLNGIPTTKNQVVRLLNNQPHLEDENAAMRLAFKISNP